MLTVIAGAVGAVVGIRLGVVGVWANALRDITDNIKKEIASNAVKRIFDLSLRRIFPLLYLDKKNEKVECSSILA